MSIFTAEGTSWNLVEATFTTLAAPLQLKTLKKIEGGSGVSTEAVYGTGATMIDRTAGIIETDNVKIEIGPSDWASLYATLLAAAIPLATLYGIFYDGTNAMEVLLSPAAQFNLNVSFTLVQSVTVISVNISGLRLAKVPFSANQGPSPVMMSLEFTCQSVECSIDGL